MTYDEWFAENWVKRLNDGATTGDIMREMWQAAHENAAKVCETKENEFKSGADCADAIREAARGG